MKKENNTIHKYKKYCKKIDAITTEIAIESIVSVGNLVKIVGMGEATHGQDKITKVRIEIFKNLVERCGYRFFILEDQYGCCELINLYINSRYESDVYDLINNLAWYWRSVHMVELVHWMKNYNLMLQSDKKLQFKGVDVQSLCGPIIEDKTNLLVANLHMLNNEIDQDNWVLADGFRDLAMYNVFMNFYDEKEKYFIYAHNYHVSKTDLVGINLKEKSKSKIKLEGREIKTGDTVQWLGCLLDKRFGSKYYSVGNLFDDGAYLETSDLIDQRYESGFDTDFKYHPKSDQFVIVKSVPDVGSIDSSTIKCGFTVVQSKMSEFDAILKIDNEEPIQLVSYEI